MRNSLAGCEGRAWYEFNAEDPAQVGRDLVHLLTYSAVQV